MNKSRTCLPEKKMTEELCQPNRELPTANLTKTRIYYEVEEEGKLAEDINSKLLNSCPSQELEYTGNVTSELIDFTEEERSRNALEFLKMELNSLKKEHSKLMLEESLTGSIFSGLKTQKLELEACLAEEFAAREQFDGLLIEIQEMLLETRDARKEEENEMNFTTKLLKKQAEAANCSLSQIENELRLALQETEEAKSSEARILKQISTLSEKPIPSMDSMPECITIPEEEFEYLIHRIYKTDAITEIEVAAARKQIDAAKASEHKALKELKRRKKQIQDMHVILDQATKKIEVAEAAKRELRKQSKIDHKKSAASQTSSRTETQTYHLIKTSKHKFCSCRGS